MIRLIMPSWRRQILDVSLIDTELVEDVKRSEQKKIVSELDFEKAHYRVNWSFLDKGYGWVRFWQYMEIDGCLLPFPRQ